ncbi:cache domain-containing protein [Roseospira goensis]|uniref:Uncharacterized protein n=1 Tax=Roseospira goensis TaxID=391922 RepID=A0A7W6WL36_9PROT|nr:cache domain-containing protein [Roseospira goensis]MBB4286007.1 hypothetical protein [Roseospira goensis]
MRTLLSAGALASVAALGLALATAPATQAAENEFRPQLERLMAEQVTPWLSDDTVVAAVKAQNTEHADLDAAAIESLDQQWRREAEAGGGPLIERVMATPLSAYLGEKKAAMEGLVSEMFVMDNRGLNVGQSDVTSDYWQGDEDKWQKTFQAGPDALFVDAVEFDDSSEAFLSQVSRTLVDPETGEPIGAITVGVNVENLF